MGFGPDRRAAWISAVIFALLSGAVADKTALAGTAASDSGAPIRFDEFIAAKESVEDALVSPDGRRLLYTLSSPRGPDGGLTLSAVMRSRAFVTELTKEGAAGRSVTADLKGAPPPCNAWSPDSRGFLLQTRRGEDMAYSYVDAASGISRVIDGPPPVAACVAWAGNRIIYAAPPQDSVDWSLSGALDTLSRRWRTAALSDKPVTTVYSSNALMPAERQAEGALVVCWPAGGRCQDVASGSYGPFSVIASHKGDRVAVLREAEPSGDPLSRFSRRRAQLEVYRLTDAGAQPLWTVGDLDVAEAAIAWSPDDGSILVAARKRGVSGDAGLYRVDGADGAVTEVYRGPLKVLSERSVRMNANVFQIGWVGGLPAAIAAGQEMVEGTAHAQSRPDYDYGGETGRRLHLYAFVDGEARDMTAFLRGSVSEFARLGDGSAAVVADGALWRLDPASAPAKVQPAGWTILDFVDGGPFSLMPDPRRSSREGSAQVMVVAQGTDQRIRRLVVDLHKGAVIRVAPQRAGASSSADLLTTASVRSDGWSTTLETHAEKSVDLLQTNPQWGRRPIGQARRFEYEVGGRRLAGWVVLPPGATESSRLPAVAVLYGGIMYDADPPEWAGPGYSALPVFNGQLLAAEGYAVVYPSLPLRGGATSDMPTTLADETVAAIDELARKGTVDPTRVALLGHSFGGYSVAAVLGRRSDRFKAGIAFDGIYDAFDAWGQRSLAETITDDAGRDFSMETGMVESGQLGMGAPFWRAPDAYRLNSPIFHVDSITAPLLLISGDYLEEGATSLLGSQRMYAALSRAGNPAVLVRYWGQGHTQEAEWAFRDEWVRVTSWLKAYIGRGHDNGGGSAVAD